jgi:hypothetical protein
MPSGGCGSGAHAVQMVKQTAHIPLLSGNMHTMGKSQKRLGNPVT